MTLSLAAPVEVEIEIKKSRFIAHVAPAASRAEAMAVVAALRQRYPGATHYCWALLAGGESGMSDDGEPGGTAGRPMLNVLQHKGLGDVVAVVVRYFGGIKLGAGGLVRAYGQAVSQALQTARMVPRLRPVERRLEVDYPLESRVRHWCQRHAIALVGVEYGERLRITLCLPQEAAERLCAQLQDMLQGQGRWLA
ncbi:MAG TPA: YigZ family protein [Candidatus Competibacteraceae bacterium]|nr:YigZ family protein [Candidatus Competibacteraceae bacterium]